jgi:hypothetical protein
VALQLDGLDKVRTARKRNPEAAQRAQSAWHRRYFARHPHACRACVGRYVLAWLLFYVFRHRVWWDCELNHRCYRRKAGTELDKDGVPLCKKHHPRADRWRRRWEGPDGNQYRPLITLARLWLLGYWLVGVPCWLAGLAGAYFAGLFLAAHVAITVTIH